MPLSLTFMFHAGGMTCQTQPALHFQETAEDASFSSSLTGYYRDIECLNLIS